MTATTLRPVLGMQVLRPEVWLYVAHARAQRGLSLPRWPDWCYLPADVVLWRNAGWAFPDQEDDNANTKVALIIAGLGAWRATQGIYRLHPGVLHAIASTPLTGALPVELLYRLPQWCVYIETPGFVIDVALGRDIEALYEADTGERIEGVVHVHGVFAYLNWHTDGPDSLCLMFDTTSPQGVDAFMSLRVPLRPGQTLEQMCSDPISGDGPADPVQGWSRAVEPYVSLALYLCSQSADIRDAKGSDARPVNPRPVKTKRGRREFPADGPRVWQVSYRMGAALQAALDREAVTAETTGETRTRMRPHVRRAHWHTFLRGPRDGDQERVLRWLPPIPINVDDDEDLVPVIRPA